MKIEIIFKTDGGTTAIREGDKKIYLVEGYEPSAKIEVSKNKRLKKVPATWNLEHLLSALIDIVEIKRGLKFALSKLEAGEPLDNVRDRHVRKLLKIINKMNQSNFSGDDLLELADTVREINYRFKKPRRRKQL